MVDKTKLLTQVILNLIEDRDFRSYELSFANGCMNKEQFEEIVNKWQNKQKRWDKEELKESIDCLKKIFPQLDYEQMSVMLQCSLIEAIET